MYNLYNPSKIIFGGSISSIVTTIVVLIFGEVSPKSIAKESPERFAMFSAPFLRVLMIVMTPFNFLFKKWKGLLSAIIKSDNKNTITEEEIAEVFRKTAYSRLPIYEENIDHICGIIYHKDFYNYVYHKDREITSIIHTALFIAKNKKIEIHEARRGFPLLLVYKNLAKSDRFGG